MLAINSRYLYELDVVDVLNTRYSDHGLARSLMESYMFTVLTVLVIMRRPHYCDSGDPLDPESKRAKTRRVASSSMESTSTGSVVRLASAWRR